MDYGRVILTLARVYTIALFVVGVLTVLWIVNPSIGASLEVAGLWFAIGGFGLLVVLTVVLVHFSR